MDYRFVLVQLFLKAAAEAHKYPGKGVQGNEQDVPSVEETPREEEPLEMAEEKKKADEADEKAESP